MSKSPAVSLEVLFSLFVLVHFNQNQVLPKFDVDIAAAEAKPLKVLSLLLSLLLSKLKPMSLLMPWACSFMFFFSLKKITCYFYPFPFQKWEVCTVLFWAALWLWKTVYKCSFLKNPGKNQRNFKNFLLALIIICNVSTSKIGTQYLDTRYNISKNDLFGDAIGTAHRMLTKISLLQLVLRLINTFLHLIKIILNDL